MAQKIQSNTTISDRALEMVMVDVLDGMLELSLEAEILGGSHILSTLSLVNTMEEKNVNAEETVDNRVQEKAKTIHKP